MRDPWEGIGPDGTITTGARRDRVPAEFEDVLAAAADRVLAAGAGTSLLLYGSVATGQAVVGRSDVDLVAIGLADADAAFLGRSLTAYAGHLCRGVEVGAARRTDLEGAGPEAYGSRVFLRHYCLLLAGPAVVDERVRYAADRRAARGFYGDIGQAATRWAAALEDGADPTELGRRVARKTLLAAASLTSVLEERWTTDRGDGAAGWARHHPHRAAETEELLAWVGGSSCTRAQVARQLDGNVADVVTAFDDHVGLW